MLIAAVLLPMALGAILPLFRFRREGARSLYIMLSVVITSALMLPQVLLGAEGRDTLFLITETLPIAFRLDGAGRPLLLEVVPDAGQTAAFWAAWEGGLGGG